MKTYFPRRVRRFIARKEKKSSHVFSVHLPDIHRGFLEPHERERPSFVRLLRTSSTGISQIM